MADMAFCRICGKQVHATARACPQCGTEQHMQQGKKSRITAIVLTFFLGGFGGHKFYLRQPETGLLYLMLCWTFAPMLVAFVDLITYVCMSDESFDNEFNR